MQKFTWQLCFKSAPCSLCLKLFVAPGQCWSRVTPRPGLLGTCRGAGVKIPDRCFMGQDEQRTCTYPYNPVQSSAGGSGGGCTYGLLCRAGSDLGRVSVQNSPARCSDAQQQRSDVSDATCLLPCGFFLSLKAEPL